MPAKSAPAKRPPERERSEPLTLPVIVAAALELTEELGFDGLSMSILGERLGVSHMAVYHHVSGKRQLQELVADAVLDRVELPGSEIDDWVERLMAHTDSFRSELVRYPGLATFVINEHHTSDAARRLAAYTITTLLDAGFTPRDAVLGREALFALSPYYLTRPAVRRKPSRRRRAGGRWDPAVEEALDAAAEVTDLDRWTFGKRAVLEGLRARLEGGRPAPARPARRRPARSA